MPTSAHTIANMFIRLARDSGKPVTNMKLQKLVFISHGFTLAIFDRPLYYHDTYAWQWGPVIKELYESLRKYGKGEVTEDLQTENDPPEISKKEQEVVEAVWERYGRFSGGQLSSLTHKPNTPWSITWENDPFGVIPQQLIADHYRQMIKSS